MLFPCFLLMLRHHIQKIYQNYIILFPPDLLWISNEYTCISMYVELVCILQIFKKMVLTFIKILSLWEKEGSSFGTSSKSRCFSVYIKPTTRPKENMSVLGCSLSFSSSIDFWIGFRCILSMLFFFRCNWANSGAPYWGVQAIFSFFSSGIRAEPKSPIFNLYSFLSSTCTKRLLATIVHNFDVYHQI